MSKIKATICGYLLMLVMAIGFVILRYYQCFSVLKIISILCIGIQMGTIAKNFYDWLTKKT